MLPSLSPSSEDLYRVLYDAPVALSFVPAAGNRLGYFEIVNQAFRDLLGYSEEELRARSPVDITHPDDRQAAAAHQASLLEGKVDSQLGSERRLITANGEVRHVRLYGSLLRGPDGSPAYAVGRMVDLTELRKLLSTQAAMIGAAPAAIVGMDGDGLITEFNPMAERIFGYTRSVVLGRPLAELIVPARLREAHREGFRRVVEGGTSRLVDRPVELTAMRADGSEFPVELTISRTQEAPPLFTGFMRDLSERRDAELALAESELRYRRIVETTSEGIWMLDADHRTSFVNPRMAEILGRRPQDMLGRHPFDLTDEDCTAIMRDSLDRIRQGAREAFQSHLVHRDGREIWAWMSASPLFEEDGSYGGALAMVTDVTEYVVAEKEREQLELQLQQSKRLETVGQLAGGVAHDFNNLLAVILNYADYLKDDVADQPDVLEGLEEIRRAAERGASLTVRLLAFSRRDAGHPETLELPPVIADVRRMLDRTLGKTVELEVEIASRLPAVTVDVHQLEQMLLNLAINGRDAMPDGGRLRIGVSELTLDELEAGRLTEARAGRYARIEVSDTGAGMSPEVAEHAFDPFFTTKPSGEGTGLGLAMVYGIATSAGGHVTLDSVVGEGTTVAVHLPAAATHPELGEDDAPPTVAAAHGQRILLVDDEDAVRRINGRILRRHGYVVVEAAGGEEALAIYQGMDPPPALVLTDVSMPRMSGIELVGRLSDDVEFDHACPPVIFMSGYSGAQAPDPAALASAAGFLQKPFSLLDLLQLVGGVLADGEPAPV